MSDFCFDSKDLSIAEACGFAQSMFLIVYTKSSILAIFGYIMINVRREFLDTMIRWFFAGKVSYYQVKFV